MLNARRQPSCDGTSRITPECQVQNAARMRPTPKRTSRDECRRDRLVKLAVANAAVEDHVVVVGQDRGVEPSDALKGEGHLVHPPTRVIFVSSALSEAVASTQERVSVYRRRVATLYLFKSFRPIPTQQNVLSDS